MELEVQNDMNEMEVGIPPIGPIDDDIYLALRPPHLYWRHCSLFDRKPASRSEYCYRGEKACHISAYQIWRTFYRLVEDKVSFMMTLQ